MERKITRKLVNRFRAPNIIGTNHTNSNTNSNTVINDSNINLVINNNDTSSNNIIKKCKVKII
jgi:hypothetical protein